MDRMLQHICSIQTALEPEGILIFAFTSVPSYIVYPSYHVEMHHPV